MTPKPDMAKVREALERYSKRPKASGSRTYPPQPSPIAQDAAIRKPPHRARRNLPQRFHAP